LPVATWLSARTAIAALIFLSIARVDAADAVNSPERRTIGELNPKAVIHLGKTADWVSITPEAVWVGSTGPFAVHRIDPETNRRVASVRLPGEPCAGLTVGFGSLWVPLCGAVPLLDGSEVTSVDASTGTILATVPTGPGPRFLTAGAGAVWTLNQGNGSVTRIDTGTKQATHTTALGIPGKGGDISFGRGMLWTTVSKVPLSLVDGATAALLCQWVGPGGDSLGIGHGAIWLTDYHAGTISRIELEETMRRCNGGSIQ